MFPRTVTIFNPMVKCLRETLNRYTEGSSYPYGAQISMGDRLAKTPTDKLHLSSRCAYYFAFKSTDNNVRRQEKNGVRHLEICPNERECMESQREGADSARSTQSKISRIGL